VASVRGDASSFGEVILDYAVKIGADMIVTGCYGHSRLREFIGGGVTRTLLRQTAMPVLMSH
jgi:nucleotide-binding universal stress UspA family protein